MSIRDILGSGFVIDYQVSLITKPPQQIIVTVQGVGRAKRALFLVLIMETTEYGQV